MSDAKHWSVGELVSGGRRHRIHRLDAIEREGMGELRRLPRSIRVLLENLLRHEDGETVTREDIAALAAWRADGRNQREIAFRPARVLLQDFTGVPAVVDLAAMRDAMAELGGDAARINPLRPADLVIDHSVQVDFFGSADALARNSALEFQRNRERYAFLRWGQSAFERFRVVPPATGIVHQVNLEYLAPVVFAEPDGGDDWLAFPDTVVGTDSHTTMINGLGVVGWGVGGIEAEACLLGQPLSMLVPDVVGFKLRGALPAGTTATDLVLTVTQMLRAHGVVGKFVEFYGEGIASLSLADRATVANMSPEYGATIGFFPVDEKTLDYLRLTGREEPHIERVRDYLTAQGLFAARGAPDPEYTSRLELDLADVEPCLAGPTRPQDRVPLREAKQRWLEARQRLAPDRAKPKSVAVEHQGSRFELSDGSVVIAAITSCTNTSNPAVLVAAGLLAKRAVERGLAARPWVKTSLAPGSRVVEDYLGRAGLLDPLGRLGFQIVGYGCTTCIGNSGPLPEPISRAIRQEDLVAAAVLSGNRNFEGRIHPEVRANYLASPPLVVAYALAGSLALDLASDPLAHDRDGKPVFLRELWPSPEEVQACIRDAVKSEQFRARYARVLEGSPEWRSIEVPGGQRYVWDPGSTYVRKPPYFDGMRRAPTPPGDIRGARVLCWLGDSVTTDHISPAGNIARTSPAGRYLIEHGVTPDDFNSYGARRGNHEVMVRGTFANIRLRNRLLPGTEGGVTPVLPEGGQTSIFEAAERYRASGVPLVVIAGREYGAGSSRDWAAKGPALLGVRAVLAQGYERIHRSNLIGMGVLPLEFEEGASPESLGLDARERFDVLGVAELRPQGSAQVRATADDGAVREFRARVRIDTPFELEYYRNGGILPYMLRQLLA